MALSKPVKTVLVVVAVVAATCVYMFLKHLTPHDFICMPDCVLDDAIYAAQQKDVKAFKRSFTEDMQTKIQRMHDSNINREMGTTSPNEREDLFWTWDTLMERMAKQGGFEVKPSSTKFLDYTIDGVAKLEIVFYDEAQKTERQKNYKVIRNNGVWRLDISADPDFVKAYGQSVRGFNSQGSNPNSDY